ncbi:ankyrin repeat domain-containing protein [Rhizobacter sp. P5_C2]
MPSGPNDYDFAMGLLTRGDEPQLEELAQLLPEFPSGVDELLGRRWIINAIDCGSLRSISWILSRGVDLSFEDEEGYTVLHAAIDRRGSERHQCLRLLLEAGAPVNARGINGWTPAHMAAVRDDVETLRVLRAYGADFTIRTQIDNYATPLEEATRSRKTAAVAFLRGKD